MKIGLIDVDGKGKYPNLALMKISRYHKNIGNFVEWYTPFGEYDIVYMSKVFTFTPDYEYVINNAKKIERGGTGYDIHKNLPKEIDLLQPDYSIYPFIDNKTSYGFLTRGCPNRCKWCIVPSKEGDVIPYMDIEDITADGRNHVVLMDNNILASDYGLKQIEKMGQMNIRVDFNQGLDARLVTDDIAKMLAKINWLKYIRFGCDTPRQVEECKNAIKMIDGYGYTGQYFLYTIIMDLQESYERISSWRDRQYRASPFSQPYRDPYNTNVIPQWKKDMARWSNRKELYRSFDFKDYSPRKGFYCIEYFK